ncbi:methyl-accepting chemotaxis protein [Herbaspirillum sp. NPDC087042]|uniref:methyl-accepting chemotaxis protein n=1 Tax=Herbaspirillum sp. NPDC087042 TaxID=3364004 RepID=UPI0038031AAB
MFNPAKIRLHTKLRLALLATWLGILLIGAASAYITRASLLDERKAGLVNLVDAASAVLRQFHAQVQAGQLDDAQARRMALQAMSKMTYGSNGYVTLIDDRPVVLTHPTLPKLIGQDMHDYLDAHGQPLYRNMVAAGNPGGGGFVEYMVRSPDGQAQLPKITYVQGFAPWHWYVSSGTLLNDINDVVWSRLRILLLALLLIGGGLSWLLNSIFGRVLHSMGGEPDYATRISHEISAGNLSVAVQARHGGSMLSAMAQMRESLLRIVSASLDCAREMSVMSREMVDGNMDLSARTERQAASLQQTSAAMQTLTLTVRETAENAAHASKFSAQAADIAQDGGNIVASVVTNMDGIARSAAQIHGFVELIQGIAAQTNILAINAAIEAARAGSHGRGFAVVAQEVRALADRSGHAARQIQQLIEASKENIATGVTLVDDAGRVMSAVVESVTRVSQLIASIEQTTDDQKRSIEEVSLAVADINDMAQQNAALVEQAAASSATLASHSGLLMSTMSHFRVAA